MNLQEMCYTGKEHLTNLFYCYQQAILDN